MLASTYSKPFLPSPKRTLNPRLKYIWVGSLQGQAYKCLPPTGPLRGCTPQLPGLVRHQVINVCTSTQYDDRIFWTTIVFNEQLLTLPSQSPLRPITPTNTESRLITYAEFAKTALAVPAKVFPHSPLWSPVLCTMVSQPLPAEVPLLARFCLLTKRLRFELFAVHLLFFVCLTTNLLKMLRRLVALENHIENHNKMIYNTQHLRQSGLYLRCSWRESVDPD